MRLSRWSRSACAFAFLALVVLPGARCNRNDPTQRTVSKAGASSTVPIVAGSGATGWQASGPDPTANGTETVLSIMNSRRGTGLQWHRGLAAAAVVHANDMSSRGYIANVSPTGVSIFSRVVSSTPRIDFTSAAAITVGISTDGQEVGEFLTENSDSLTVIQSATYTHVGIGYSNGYWAVIFAQNPVPAN